MISLDKKWVHKCEVCVLYFPCKSSLLLHQLDEHNEDKKQNKEYLSNTKFNGTSIK